MAEKKTVDIILRLPKNVHAKAKKRADKERRSLNSLIVMSVEEKCNNATNKDLVVSK